MECDYAVIKNEHSSIFVQLQIGVLLLQPGKSPPGQSYSQSVHYPFVLARSTLWRKRDESFCSKFQFSWKLPILGHDGFPI